MCNRKGIKTQKGRATETTKGGGTQDAALARAILAHAFATKAERDDARKGVFQAGGIIEDVADLATELAVNLIHPDVLPHALPVLLRAARAGVRRRGERGQAVGALLQKIERAATGKEGAR